MLQSFTRMRNDTLSAFGNIDRVFEFLQFQFSGLTSLQSFLSSLLNSASFWMQTFLWALLIYLLTTILGVGFTAGNYL